MLERMGELPHYERLPRIVLWHELGYLTPPQLNRGLAQWWTHGGYPNRLGVRRLLRMLRTAGFITDDETVIALVEPMTVYLGAIPANARGSVGAVTGTSPHGSLDDMFSRIAKHTSTPLLFRRGMYSVSLPDGRKMKSS
jgi:hypothetical protein